MKRSHNNLFLIVNPSLWWGYDFFACKINSVAININTGNETMKKIPEFKDLYTRLFTIEDISEVTQLPPSTLRTWATRGIVSLSTSYNPGKNAGRGEKSLYSVYDALQFIFLGRMSRDAQPVKVISECCFSEILDITLERLSEIAVGIYHAIAATNGILTVDEIREVEGYSPLPKNEKMVGAA